MFKANINVVNDSQTNNSSALVIRTLQQLKDKVQLLTHKNPTSLKKGNSFW